MTLESVCANRRESRRVAREGGVWYRSGTGNFRKGCSVEVSGNGARLVLDGQVKSGDTFDLTFDLGGGRFVAGTARTVWVERLPGSSRNLAGVAFNVVSADRQSYRGWLDRAHPEASGR